MKGLLLSGIFILIFGIQVGFAQSLVTGLRDRITTEPQPTRTAAVQVAEKLAAQIESGDHYVLYVEARRECPNDPRPQFEVKGMRLDSYWLYQGKKFNEHYRAVIDFTLSCRR